MTLLCRFCSAPVRWHEGAWVDYTDGDACDGYLVHEPASLDVASCSMCIAAIVNPRMSLPSALTLVPAGMIPSYDSTDNGGWDSNHACDTCGREHMHVRRVVTLTPERPNMPTTFRPYEPIETNVDHPLTSAHRLNAATEPVVTDTCVMVYERTGVDICTCCLDVAANGDSDGLYPAALSRVPDGYHVVPGPYTIGGAESWFSTRRCDTCGDTLAGDRHQATLMSIERVPCQDCIDLVRHTH